jgi:bidirectional [NiFe] hydrogenase diaphorase subunit
MTLTIEDLREIAARQQDHLAGYSHRLHVCVAAGCLSCRSQQVKEALEKEMARRHNERFLVKGVGCLGLCSAGPMVAVEPAGVLYQRVCAQDAPAIVDALEGGRVERLACDTGGAFFKRQHKIVLENCGRIDPEHIEDYIGVGGYQALYDALRTMGPKDVIDQVARSGLRGRGGAGYPTGLKWTTVAKAPTSPKYVVCNADEGDPGAFMDRSVLESDPHRVLEGMAIAAYAVGAQTGYIYVRAEYPLAVQRIRKAIHQAECLGVLGRSIFNTPFAFDVNVRLGAGAFVCGEETALIASIEGRLGRPRPRPPYPAEFGLWGRPTLINNVETFANIVPIIRRGWQWFAGIGSPGSKGTKVFALAGHVGNTGLIEVPMGIGLRDIVFDMGGGISNGRRFKAVQTGGPSGGCIPASLLDMAVDYESLAKAGSIMGSGGMIIMDDGACMVDMARFFMDFCRSEACGKCTPCRVGTTQVVQLLGAITRGQARPDDLDRLEDLCDLIKQTSLCGLGQSAPNPVLSTLRHFRSEYLAHIHDRSCPAGTCRIGPAQEAP